jgi:hypothetical protein
MHYIIFDKRKKLEIYFLVNDKRIQILIALKQISFALHLMNKIESQNKSINYFHALNYIRFKYCINIYIICPYIQTMNFKLI